MKRRTAVWVVERFGIRNCRGDEWFGPTVGAALTRDEARAEMKDWQRRNPHDRYRLRRYVREEK